jgi:hypothetical protein
MISEPIRNSNAKRPDVRKTNASQLSASDEAILADPDKQEEYRRLFNEELRRRSCPGCGETNDLF